MKNDNYKKRLKRGCLLAIAMPFMVIGTSLSATHYIGRRGKSAFEDVRHIVTAPVDEAEQKCGDIPDPTPYIGYGAEEADYFEQPSFVVDYFRNLTEHYPTNNSGNCTYTAAAMLLSYYDVYWNRYIVPDQFNDLAPSEVLSAGDDAFSSPGIIDYYAPVWTKQNPEMREPDPNLDSAEYIRAFEENKREAYTIYLDYMLAHASDNLVSKLYRIALDPTVNAYDFQSDPSPSLGLSGLQVLLNAYFAEFNLGTKIQLNVVYLDDFDNGVIDDSEMHKELRYEAIQRLQSGQPLIIAGRLSKERYGKGRDGGGNQNGAGRHSVVAYAYDSQWDYIVGHMGWKTAPEYTKALLDLEFESFDAFAYLEISPDLEFTPRNYRFDDHGPTAATDLCSHVHGNYVAVDYEDNFYHALQCICGAFEYESHTTAIEQHDNQCHKKVCTECGHVEYVQHSLNFEQIDSQHHREYCLACGYDEEVPHSLIPMYDVGWYCRDCQMVFTYNNPPIISPWTPAQD